MLFSLQTLLVCDLSLSQTSSGSAEYSSYVTPMQGNFCLPCLSQLGQLYSPIRTPPNPNASLPWAIPLLPKWHYQHHHNFLKMDVQSYSMQSEALGFYSHMIIPPRNLFTSGVLSLLLNNLLRNLLSPTCFSKPWTFNLFI